MKYQAITKAASAWVNEFNTIQTSMIEALMKDDFYAWQEVTAPGKRHRSCCI